jgi:hypothetical protein
MRALVLAAVLLVGLSATTAGCETSCPTALAEGVLVRGGDALLLRDGNGFRQTVVWPSGYGVREDNGILVLVDWIGNVKAREGDRIRAGGGVGTDGLFHACGDVTVAS